ncbi:hypothetical protein [uncultured Ferrimonas sp.]|uniref:hypothetical protein n=1 Tax=uncultured Ferrimonas sp. TaxID=432640 RepID=UPI002605B9B7|nr:hypothetical protein [uncultured Ferrimonas sp.]
MRAVNSMWRRSVLVGLVLAGFAGSVSAQGLRQEIDSEIKQHSQQASTLVQQQALRHARHDAWNALMGYQVDSGNLTVAQEAQQQSDQIVDAAKQDAQAQAASYWQGQFSVITIASH